MNDRAAITRKPDAPQSFQERERIMNELERQLRNDGIDARITEIVNQTAIVSCATLADFLFARSILERQGWRVIKPQETAATQAYRLRKRGVTERTRA